MFSKLQKITLSQRSAFLKAVQGGGRASDEVKKLQSQGLRPFDTVAEIQSAYQRGRLISLPSIDAGRRFFVDQDIGRTDPANQEWYNLVNPQAYEDFNTFIADMFYAYT